MAHAKKKPAKAKTKTKTTKTAAKPKPAAKTVAKPKTAAKPIVVSTVDPRGKRVKSIGLLRARGSSLDVVASDVVDATGWRGRLDDDTANGSIAIGPERGFKFTVGSRSGQSFAWMIDKSTVALVDYAPRSSDPKELERALGLRLPQWGVRFFPKRIGKVFNHSGVLSIALPHRVGPVSERDLATASSGKVVADATLDRLLVPLETGTYAIEHYPLVPTRQRGPYQDDVAEYGSVYLVTYRDRLPKRFG